MSRQQDVVDGEGIGGQSRGNSVIRLRHSESNGDFGLEGSTPVLGPGHDVPHDQAEEGDDGSQ